MRARTLPILASVVLLTLAATGCVDERDSRAYSETPPSRDRFVGSIYFATASSTLSKAAAADLSRMALRMRERRPYNNRIILIGYADRNRGVEENSELAGERAQRVALALEKRGIELERMVIDGRGVRTTRKGDGERRVDIYLDFATAPNAGLHTMYPVLVGLFLLVTLALAVVIFRRR